MKNNKITIAIVVCVVVAGLSFWGGMKYGQSKNNVNSLAQRQGSFGQSQNGPNNLRGGMRGGSSGGAVSGEVISMDSKSLTVKLRDGGSKIVLFSPSLKVEKTVDGTVSDVAVGKTVMITGTANPDGSVSASSVQLRPAFVAPVNTN